MAGAIARLPSAFVLTVVGVVPPVIGVPATERGNVVVEPPEELVVTMVTGTPAADEAKGM